MSVEWMLVKREMIRFLRQRNRVGAAIGQPIIFWLLFSAGFRDVFEYESLGGGQSYQEFYFPGTLALIILFTAIFSSFSIIEDRNEGFLKGVLVAPVSRSSIVIGKVLGSTFLASFQAMVFLVLAPLAGISLSFSGILTMTAVMLILSFELSLIGFCFAWKMESTGAFHAVMSLILLPMWLLSGAFFPLDNGPAWLMWGTRLNPMTYGVSAMRQSLYLDTEELLSFDFMDFGFSMALTIVFSLLLFFKALSIVNSKVQPKGA